ncbi:MAG TPA: ribose-phosphate diphosphokinase [Polyangiales bacterium]|nr:ribose-phosphate diphosphokinase [Polyangiales bacterium]
MTNPSIALFSLETGAPLLGRICRQLGVEPARQETRSFEDGEHKMRPLESVRGRDVYIVESLFGESGLSVNDKLLRVLLFTATLRDAGAERVTVVAPYLCYARKDRRTKPRDPVTSRYLATLFEAVGTARVVTIEVHNPAAYQNAFRIPAELLTAAPAFVDFFARLLGEQPAAVVSPDPGGVKRAELFREALEQRLRRGVGFAFLDKHRSQGVVRSGAMAGEVGDRAAIILDDLISSGTTLARAAAACRQRGARAVYAAAAHGVFSADAGRVLGASELDRIVVLDTIPARPLGLELERRLEWLDCSALLAQSIRRLHEGGSLTELSAS